MRLLNAHIMAGRPGTSLGHQEGRRVFREGPKFFELCQIFLNYVQHIFTAKGEKFSAPPWLRAFWQIMQRDSDMLIAVCHVNLYLVKRSMSESVAMLPQV